MMYTCRRQSTVEGVVYSGGELPERSSHNFAYLQLGHLPHNKNGNMGFFTRLCRATLRSSVARSASNPAQTRGFVAPHV